MEVEPVKELKVKNENFRVGELILRSILTSEDSSVLISNNLLGSKKIILQFNVFNIKYRILILKACYPAPPWVSKAWER